MSKRDLLNKLNELLEKKQMHKLDGIGTNSNKATLENAIECLEATDELLDDYFTIFKVKYPNSAIAILQSGNWKKHNFNRLYVWNSVKIILN